MSRIGKLPIKVPSTVDINCNGQDVTVKGKFGTLQNQLPDSLEIQQIDETLVVSPRTQTRTTRSLHGLYRTLVDNWCFRTISIKFNFKWCGISCGCSRSINCFKFRI